MSRADSSRVLTLLALVVVGALVGLTVLIRLSKPAQDEGSSVERDPLEGDDLGPMEAVRLEGSGGRSGAAAAAGPRGTEPREPLPTYVVEGATRWQRRLSAGDAFQDLELRSRPDGANLEGIAGRLSALAPHLLPYHDAYMSLGSERSLVRDMLLRLTVPRRDRASFALHMVDDIEHRLGLGALLRVWSRRPGFDRPAAESGSSLLERLLRIAGGSDGDGFDAVVTGARGTDVFPRSPMESWPIAGYFTPKDDLVVLARSDDAAWTAHVLKHELVHAWQHRHVGPWTSRFLGEGIAEYLAWIEPEDRSLEVPPERLKHDFQALLTLIAGAERFGVHLSTMAISDLVRLSPRGFYALGHFGYLIGEATMAYLGSDTLAGALREHSEGRLVEAVRGVTWAKLLAFVREHAEGGVAAKATVVRDRADESSFGSTSDLRAVLRQLGVRIPAGWRASDLDRLLRLARPIAVNNRVRLDDVMKTLLSTPGATRVFVEGTAALDGGFRLADDALPAGWSLGDVDPTTRLAFVTAFVDGMSGSAGNKTRSITLLRIGVQATPTWPITPAGHQATISGVAKALKGAPSGVVVLVASADAMRSLIADSLYRTAQGAKLATDDDRVGDIFTQVVARELAEARVRPTAVLVVDLSEGQGDADRIAQAFQLHLQDAKVALWDPQRPLR